MHTKSGNIVGAFPHTSSWSIQHATLPPIRAILYWLAYAVLVPMYKIWIAVKYCFKADNYALPCILVPVNCFGSASFIESATHIARTSYSGHQNGPTEFFCYTAGIVAILCCIMAVFCIYTLLGPIYLNKRIILEKINKTKQKNSI